MVVVLSVLFVIVAVPGLPTCADHVPAPVAAIVAVPPGRTWQATTWSAPALGFAVTTMVAVSVHPLALVQIKLYVPAALYVVMVVVGLVGAVIVAVPAFPVIADHVPAPVPFMVALPPGSMAQTTV